jgi:non-heme chloroperoxidase
MTAEAGSPDGLRLPRGCGGRNAAALPNRGCIHEFSEVDYTADLEKIDKPTLVIHGADDQIVPIAASGEKTAKIVKGARLKVYKGGSHGLAQVDPDTFNADVLAFVPS